MSSGLQLQHIWINALIHSLQSVLSHATSVRFCIAPDSDRSHDLGDGLLLSSCFHYFAALWQKQIFNLLAKEVVVLVTVREGKRREKKEWKDTLPFILLRSREFNMKRNSCQTILQRFPSQCIKWKGGLPFSLPPLGWNAA